MIAFIVAAVGNTHLHLNVQLLTYLSGLGVPLVVGLITKWKASPALKAWCNFLLSAIAGGLTVAITSNGDVQLSTWVVGILQTFVVSIASYYGLWKHTLAPKIAESTPNFGIGTPVIDVSSAPVHRDDILSPRDVDVAEPSDAELPPARTRPLSAKKAPARKAAKRGGGSGRS